MVDAFLHSAAPRKYADPALNDGGPGQPDDGGEQADAHHSEDGGEQQGPERMPLAVLNPTVVKVSSVMATAEVRP